MKLVLTTIFVIATATAAFAQGPKPGDASPPGALKQGGIPPAAAMRRGDDMGPLVQDQSFKSRSVSGFANNPTPTRNDPPGTRTQCRGGCQ